MQVGLIPTKCGWIYLTFCDYASFSEVVFLPTLISFPACLPACILCVCLFDCLNRLSVLVFLGSAQSAVISSWTSPGSMYVSLRGPVCGYVVRPVRMRESCVCPTWHSAYDPWGPLCVCKSVCVLASLQLSPRIRPSSDDWTSQRISPSCYLQGST